MLKYLIIEDDENAALFLKQSIETINSEFISQGIANSIDEGLKKIKKFKPNLIFLDIELKDGNGFDLLKEFKNPNFGIIFITAFDNYYKQAFDHFAFSYILKPFTVNQLKNVLDKFNATRYSLFQKIKELNAFISKENTMLLINNGKEYHSVLIKDIIYLKADGNYTEIITNRFDLKKIVANENLAYYSTLLIPKRFFRASRFYLININHIASIYKKEHLNMSNKERIKVSVRNKVNLTTLIETLS